MIGLAISLGTAWLLGFAAVHATGLGRSGPGGACWTLGLSTGIGLGLAAVVQFCARWIGVDPAIAAWLLEGMLLLGLCWLALRRRGDSPRPASPVPATATDRVMAAAVLVLAVIVALTFWARYSLKPHGIGDAIEIWNLRARALFYGSDLTTAIQAAATNTHPDYPLLLPCAIARTWTHLGEPSTWAPGWIAFLFAAATVAVLYGGLAPRIGRPLAMCATGALLGLPAFVVAGSNQWADVPLAFFVLTGLALITRARDADSPTGPALLGGVVAGLAAFTKNEGLVVAVVLALLAWRSRTARWYSLGVLPVLSVVAVFKLGYAPTNDLVANLSQNNLQSRLADGSRYAAVFESAGRFLVGPGLLAWILAPCLAWIWWRRRPLPRDRQALLFVTAMVGLYAAVYVVASPNIVWHLATSHERLFLQLTPAWLWAIFSSAPAESRIAGAVVDDPRSPRSLSVHDRDAADPAHATP